MTRPWKIALWVLLTPIFVVVLGIAILLALPGHTKDARIPIARVGTTPGLEGIDADIKDRISRGRYPGAVIIIAKGEQILHSAALGESNIEKKTPMRMDSIFRAMSMTKPVTTVAVMQLVEQDRIDLDAPVTRYLPELAHYEDPKQLPLTLRHLLTHTGGQGFGSLPRGPTTLADRMKELTQEGLSDPPGEKWRYSGVDGFDIIARMVEVVSGQPYAQYLKEHIFEPLGMKDTTYVLKQAQLDRFVELYKARWGKIERDVPWLLPPDGFYPSGGAGLYTTAPDYIRLTQMLANGGALGSVRLLKQTTIQFIASEQLPVGFPGLPKEYGWAIGMRRVSENAKQLSPLPVGSYGWSGAFGTHFWVDPNSGFSAVFMINLSNAGGAGSEDAFDFERLVADACKSDVRCAGEALDHMEDTLR